MLAKAVKRADEKPARAASELLPANLTPHSLRRTFASLLFAIGEAPRYVTAPDGPYRGQGDARYHARQMH
jgi:integrase